MRLGLISDFNIDILSRLIQNENKEYEVISFPFGQVYQGLFSISNNKFPTSCYIGGTDNKLITRDTQESLDTLVVWTRAENILKEYTKLLNYEEIDESKLLEEVRFFTDTVIKCAKNIGNVFIMSWYKPFEHTGYGMSDHKKSLGVSYFTNLINIEISKKLSSHNNIFILDSEKYFYNIKNPISSKMWYASKTPYSLDVFKNVKNDLYHSFEALVGKARRLIVVDLDNTMWGGILGDVGWDGLQIGGHDYIGEAFTDFQKALKSLTHRGILLAIASKNYEENALEAIEKNPEMVLKKDDFASWRINWKDKAQNIIEIANEVNLGLSSVVFLDDNPAERGRVAEALPEIFVPDWPKSPVEYKNALLSLSCFNTATVSKEDRQRSKMFVQERERKNLLNSLSHEEWLKSISMKVEVEKLKSTNSTRTVQLLNKTNQFNMVTRRMSETEFIEWNNSNNREMYTFRVSDKFGDSGLTGVISYEIVNSKMIITDFIMSCRVMGREIERFMLGYLIKIARDKKLSLVEAEFVQTDRNQPMYEFLNNSGLEKFNNLYTWNCRNNYNIPEFIEIVEK